MGAMSLSETKYLLRRHRIFPNRLLGQNFMVEASVFQKLSSYASLSNADVVLDVGAGFGFLTRFLANKCKSVLAVEKDPRIAEVLHEQLRGICNVSIIEGDVLKAPVPDFNKVVSIPPYQVSSRLLMWLFDRSFDCAVLVFQKEFAKRLVASVGTEDYSWLTVFAYYAAQVELLAAVPRWMFFPQPEVDSVIVRLTKREAAPFEVKDAVLFRQMLRFLFTERNKKLGNAVAPFIKNTLKIPAEEAKKLVSGLPFRDKRVRVLAPEDFGALANALIS
jgi:16S rRNA (adenine1518-N6/adenine1519-N6)-dimethyltransferase